MTRNRWIGAAVAALLAAVAAVAVATTAVGTDDRADTLNAFSSGTPATLSAATIDSLRSSGVEVDADSAVTVAAPNGSDRWTIAQTADGACLLLPGEVAQAGVCGTTAGLRRGGLVSFVPDEAASAALGIPKHLKDAGGFTAGKGGSAAPSRAGAADFRGLTANDVTDVAAVAADGSVLATVGVDSNVYELADVPLAEVSAIKFTHEAGGTTAVPVDR